MNIYRYISTTFFMLSISMFCSFLATILIMQKVSIANFGLFNLLKSLLPLFSTIALLGIDKAYIKNFSNKETKDTSYYLLIFITVISMCISYLCVSIYGIYEYYFFILAGIVFGAINFFLTSYFRLKNKYLLAQFILGGHKIIFFILIVYFFYFDYLLDDYRLIVFLCLSYFIPSLFYFIYYIENSKNKEGLNFFEFSKLLKIGFYFFVLNCLNQIVTAMDKWLIPILYDNEILGIYSALGFVYITVFSMFSSAIGYVIFPEILKNKIINIKKIMFPIILIPVLLAFIFIFFGHDLIKFICGEKYFEYYDSKINLYFIILGIIHFFNSITHWIILSKGNTKIFFKYIIFVVIQILSVSIILFIFSNSLSFNIHNIILYVVILMLFKLSANILLLRRYNIYNI